MRKWITALSLVALLSACVASYATLPEVPEEAELVEEEALVCPTLIGYKQWWNRPGTSTQFAEWLTFGLLNADDELGPVVLYIRFANDSRVGEAFVSTPAGVEYFDSIESLKVKYPTACHILVLQHVKGA